MGKEKKILNIVNKPSAYMIHIWKIILTGSSFSTREVFDKLYERMINVCPSRASVINYLNSLVDTGLITYEEATGKGGIHRIYTLKGTPDDFKDTLRLLSAKQIGEAYMIPLENL